MVKTLLLVLLLATPPGAPTGSIAGSIAFPPNFRITKPAQVAVFTGDYVEQYLSEVQTRVDTYWEEYRPAFIQDKGAFVLFRERAKVQAFDVTLSRMRKNDPLKAANFVLTTSNGNFEFRGVPQGECKIAARISLGDQEFIWSETVILTDKTPPAVILKPTTP